MEGLAFLSDLAIVMITAGVASLLFHKIRQPVLLGYILAGMIIGPHTPGALVRDPQVINNISNLGVVLLLFTLGLEFSVTRLKSMGIGVVVVTIVEVGTMLWIGYSLGHAFGWGNVDSLFFGGMLAFSSTMAIGHTLTEMGLKHAPFARTAIGMLVMEDVLAVVLITLLTAVALGGTVEAGTALTVLGHLGLFIVVGMVLGLLLLPRLVDRVAGYGSNEMLLIVALGICFGISLLAAKLGFSVALGAFIAGIMIAESGSSARVIHLVEPLRDMFAALFFVAIGLRIDPSMLLTYLGPAIVAALVVIVGKTFFISMGMFTVGKPPHTSVRTGLSMAVIGEFSFVIATLGSDLGATSHFLYPIAAAVAVLCMASSTYLVQATDSVVKMANCFVPKSLRVLANSYSGWLENLKPVAENAAVAAMLRRFLWHIAVNVVLVVALFMFGAYVNQVNWPWFQTLDLPAQSRHTIIWACALFLSLPMLIAVYRKAEALGMLLAELGIREYFAGQYTHAMRAVLAQLIPLATLLGLALLVGALSSTILPSKRAIIILMVAGVATALVLWRRLVKIHARLQATLRDTIYGSEP